MSGARDSARPAFALCATAGKPSPESHARDRQSRPSDCRVRRHAYFCQNPRFPNRRVMVRVLVCTLPAMFESFPVHRMSSTAPIPSRVLVADDQADVLEALRWLLAGEGYEPQFVSSTDAVMERLRAESFDLLLMDLNYTRDTTSGREGLELISRVRSHDPALPIVVMTGWGSIDTAVEAMRRGAKSFVQKPWEDVTLLEILAREVADARAAKRRD